MCVLLTKDYKFIITACMHSILQVFVVWGKHAYNSVCSRNKQPIYLGERRKLNLSDAYQITQFLVHKHIDCHQHSMLRNAHTMSIHPVYFSSLQFKLTHKHVKKKFFFKTWKLNIIYRILMRIPAQLDFFFKLAVLIFFAGHSFVLSYF